MLGVCRICGHEEKSHYNEKKSDESVFPDIGCSKCDDEYRACPGFSSK
jgi:hypothetical protein